MKFFLLAPVYDGFSRLLPASPHAEIPRRVPTSARRLLDVSTGTALVPTIVAPARPGLTVVGVDISPEMLRAGREKLRAVI